MPESGLQRDAVKLLERNGLYVVNQWGTPLAYSGVPDLITCCDGGFLAFEMKYLNGKTDAAQEMHARKIRRAGGLVYVPKALEQIELIIQEVRGASRIRPYCPTCMGGNDA